RPPAAPTRLAAAARARSLRRPLRSPALASSVLPTWAAFLVSLRPGRPQGKRAPRRRCSAANAGLDTPTAASPTNIGIGNHAEPPRFSFMTIRIGTSERDGTFYSQARALKTLFERRPALAAVEGMESQAASTENRQPPARGRDRFRLHGLELDRPRQKRRDAVRAADRARHGGADECRPAVLHRAGAIADPVVFRSARAADCGRAADERHGAARP